MCIDRRCYCYIKAYNVACVVVTNTNYTSMMNHYDESINIVEGLRWEEQRFMRRHYDYGFDIMTMFRYYIYNHNNTNMTMDNVDSDSDDNVDNDEDDVRSPKLPRSPTPSLNEDEDSYGGGLLDTVGAIVAVGRD